MVLPEHIERTFEGQSFLSWPIGVAFGLSTVFIIEMKMGVSDMPLQLEFDSRLSRSTRERLKRQCFTSYLSYLISADECEVMRHSLS